MAQPWLLDVIRCDRRRVFDETKTLQTPLSASVCVCVRVFVCVCVCVCVCVWQRLPLAITRCEKALCWRGVILIYFLDLTNMQMVIYKAISLEAAHLARPKL